MREKAHALIDAFFDSKEIIMKDPEHGVSNWVSIKHPEYWSYLTMFCKNVNKYKIIDNEDSERTIQG